jgi:hypothetical protein
MKFVNVCSTLQSTQGYITCETAVNLSIIGIEDKKLSNTDKMRSALFDIRQMTWRYLWRHAVRADSLLSCKNPLWSRLSGSKGHLKWHRWKARYQYQLWWAACIDLSLKVRLLYAIEMCVLVEYGTKAPLWRPITGSKVIKSGPDRH